MDEKQKATQLYGTMADEVERQVAAVREALGGRPVTDKLYLNVNDEDGTGNGEDWRLYLDEDGLHCATVSVRRNAESTSVETHWFVDPETLDPLT